MVVRVILQFAGGREKVMIRVRTSKVDRQEYTKHGDKGK